MCLQLMSLESTVGVLDRSSESGAGTGGTCIGIGDLRLSLDLHKAGVNLIR